jgi:ABC-type Zn uptake system ZnuABC Zn-binding protein ZnuA
MKRKTCILLLALLSGTFLLACNGASTAKYDVFVTVYPLKYLVDSLAVGTEITCGMVPGVTSHQDSIDWSPKQIIAMTEAEYLFYIGANFDVYIDNQVDSIFLNKPVKLVKLETEVVNLMIEGVIDTHDGVDTLSLGLDPHFWTSPKRLLLVVELIYSKLLDETYGYPEFAETFTQNRLILIEELTALDAAYDTVITPESKMIMTSTNLPGYHEETDQFTTQQKDAIVAEATLNDIRYIVYEKNASSPLSNAIFESLLALGRDPVKLEYDIMHTLSVTEKNLGHDYYDVMMENNLELLKTATGYLE